VASNTVYTALAGTTVLGAAFVNQESTLTPGDAAGDFADSNGVYWHPTMLVQASGASLTVVLDNVANQSFVRADGVRIVQLTGAVNQNNDAHLQSGSPAIAAGDPTTPFLSEPFRTAIGLTSAPTATPRRARPAPIR